MLRLEEFTSILYIYMPVRSRTICMLVHVSYNSTWRLATSSVVFQKSFFYVTYFCSGIGADDRLSAEEMDNMRDQATAYEYLCHLEEAKQ